QASGLYAQKLAEQGFMTLAFDPSFTGESSPSNARYMNSPDINTEDFMAAVDYLMTEQNMKNVGIAGICGWGGMALNAAAADPRIKATVSSTMYDMSRVTQKGCFDSADSREARKQAREAMAMQRLEDCRNQNHQLAGGVIDPLPEDAPDFVKDYYAYYKTPRGYHPRSLNSNDGWTSITGISLMNRPLMQYIDEIDNAVLLVHGDRAHSYYFSRDVFEKLKGDNKKFITVKGASHTDLYDQEDQIPFDEITDFFKQYLLS
ncbi:MAG: alpha/beta hydrolase, partial [Erysipelotrichaceae bacterium]|nr:alpha/beta hydrolase [Erysipelotrichaceae bacterium]